MRPHAFGLLILAVTGGSTLQGHSPWKLLVVAPFVAALLAFGVGGLYQRVRVRVERARTARLTFVEWPWRRPRSRYGAL